MGLASRLLEVVLEIQELDLPWRRLRRWTLGLLGAGIVLFPATFETTLFQFSEARACTIVQTLANNFVLPTGKLEVVQRNGFCQLSLLKTENTSSEFR
jgi:hypothetical protein